MKALIVGGGIGGLTTALRLHELGVECVVFEQSDQIRELGVGFNVLPHAIKELAELGLLSRLEQIGIATGELIYANRLGQEVWREPRGIDAGYAVPQLALHRGRLQGLLAAMVRARLGEGAIRVGHRLIGFDQDEDGVTADFVDRSGIRIEPVRGDLLVGADGIHSMVRSVLYPDEGAPRWNGVMTWRGATDWPRFLSGRSMIIAGGMDAKLVVYPIAEGDQEGTRLTNWAICVKTGDGAGAPPRRQDWSRPGERDELLAHAGMFSLPYVDIQGLVAATPTSYELPMCDRDPLPFWTRGRVTLLGDAGHPMYPVGSNGAGQAILDASCLSKHLGDSRDVIAALTAYESERRPVTAEIIRLNRLGGPEGVIDEVERRAPNGFTRLDDVISHEELAHIVATYAHAARFTVGQVNHGQAKARWPVLSPRTRAGAREGGVPER